MRASHVLILIQGATVVLAQGQQIATTTVLSVAPNPSVLSQPVTLTATVVPPSAGGKVTFYDGATAILGVSAVTGGKATLVTSLLGSGARSLQARYSGDATTRPSTSTAVQQSVRVLPSGSFYRGNTFPAGDRPSSMAVADFNRDGHLDLAVANDGPNGGTVTLFMGGGAGNFKPGGSPFATGVIRPSILVGDFNGDGNPDLIAARSGVTDLGSETVKVLLGDGKGNFQAPQNITSSRLSPSGIAVGDFDRDGNQDLAIGNYVTNEIAVFSGDGQGGFAEFPRIPVEHSPCALAAGDFNSDGATDLVVASCSRSYVQVWLGNGTGSFVAGQQFGGDSLIGDARVFAVGDFNGDGNLDLVLLTTSGHLVLLSNGTGGFTQDYSPGQDSDLIAGDFNGDGKLDVATLALLDVQKMPGTAAELEIKGVSVSLGDGAGGFTFSYYPSGPIAGEVRTRSFPMDPTPNSFALGDFNEDGTLDIVTAIEDPATHRGKVTLLLATGPLISLSSHGQFVVGGKVEYTLVIKNPATPPIKGELKVSQSFPAGLTPQAATGSGWVCLIGDQLLTCVRSDALPGPAEYPPIVVVVGIGGGACQVATTSAEVSVAGTRTDFVSVEIPLSGCLTIQISPLTPGQFVVGRLGEYSLVIKNPTPLPVQGNVTVSQVLPTGLMPQTVIGNGWICSKGNQTITCTRSDAIPGPGEYPVIRVVVGIGGEACQVATISAEVSVAGTREDFASGETVLSGCLTVVHEPPILVVNNETTITLTVSAASGAELRPGIVSVTEFLTGGLTVHREPTGDGWQCSLVASQIVSCSRETLSSENTSYPPIKILIEATLTACPTAFLFARVDFGRSRSESVPQGTPTLPVDLHGCLEIGGIIGNGTAGLLTIPVTSHDNHPLSLQVLDANEGLIFSDTLQPLGKKNIYPFVVAPCYGDNSIHITVTASTGVGPVAAFPFRLMERGVSTNISFPLKDGTLPPNVSQTLSGPTVSPSQDPSCTPPKLTMSFLQKAPDGSTYDFKFDPASLHLDTGTVASTITMTAQENGADIRPTNGPASIKLEVPSLTGVIKTLSLDARTGSTFQIGVTGYSTPRETDPVPPETGPPATTQVCFEFLPSPGARLPANTPFCALRQDIAIWYERPASYATGSWFKESVTVSFNGDVKAIGQIKAWIRNKVGDGSPSCIDFQSGASQSCK